MDTAASVANIVQLLAQTISTIHDIHSRFEEADFTLINLISQLTVLKASLNKIEEWINTSLDEAHHQVILDLDLIINCLMVLIRQIDQQILSFRSNEDGSLTSLGKTKLVLKSNKIEAVQKMVQNQTSALNLLLTACNCKSASDQRASIEQKATRKAVSRIEKDTASLLEVRDNASFVSRQTDTLSKLSVVFAFDHELFHTNVYDRCFRGSMKEALQKCHRSVRTKLGSEGDGSQIVQDAASEQHQRGKAIDRMLRNDRKRREREHKVLLLGLPDCGKDVIMRQAEVAEYTQRSEEEKLHDRHKIYEKVVSMAQSLCRAMADSDVELEFVSNIEHCAAIEDFVLDPDINASLPQSFSTMVASIWSEMGVLSLTAQSDKLHSLSSASYFFDDIFRIGSPDYMPTTEDLYKAFESTNSVRTANLSGRIKLIGVTCRKLHMQKWIHQFEHDVVLIYVVDMSSYDQVVTGPDGRQKNKIVESIESFRSIVNLPWFKNTETAVLLGNTAAFRSKLTMSPLSNIFSDFTGDNDLVEAVEYIRAVFQRGDPRYRRLIVLFGPEKFDDDAVLRYISAVAGELIRDQAIKELGWNL